MPDELNRYSTTAPGGAGSAHASDLQRFVREHLTATAVMVELAAPLPPLMRALEARRYLDQNDFDLALVDDERLRIVMRASLRRLGRADLSRSVAGLAESPKRDRLIERTLPIRDVVHKLLADSEPLLVVGAAGATHVVTRADFAGVAGTAVVLAYLLALDRGLNELLRAYEEPALALVPPDRLKEAEERRARADREGAALELIDYLGMGSRFTLLRKLGLAKELGLGMKADHDLLLKTRNAAAHGVLSDPEAALRAVEKAEVLLDRVAEAARDSSTAP
jgi:hypothetical protein